MNGDRPHERGLTRRERWPHYATGMLTETAFILGLAAFALLLAVIAKAVF
jgi:hypothetical protein